MGNFWKIFNTVLGTNISTVICGKVAFHSALDATKLKNKGHREQTISQRPQTPMVEINNLLLFVKK